MGVPDVGDQPESRDQCLGVWDVVGSLQDLLMPGQVIPRSASHHASTQTDSSDTAATHVSPENQGMSPRSWSAFNCIGPVYNDVWTAWLSLVTARGIHSVGSPLGRSVAIQRTCELLW